MMARKTKPGDFRLKITTPDGNTMEVSGTMHPLASLATAMLVLDEGRKRKVVKAELDLLLALDVALPDAVVAQIKSWGVYGDKCLEDFVAAGGRLAGKQANIAAAQEG